ncbi:MAG: M16 family metallopeptidase [Crocinitomicaceae bacterium]
MNRTIAPAFKQPDKLDLVLPEKIDLANGIQLFWIKHDKDSSVKLDIEWCAGSKYQTKRLSASFANKLLLAGTAERSAGEIASELDFYGGYVQHEIDRDHAGITLYGLMENMSSIFKIFKDGYMNAAFPEEEFEKERAVGLTRFQIESKKVKTIARRAFNQSIFGRDTEYGQVAQEEDFANINRSDIMDFYETYYRKQAPTLFLVGNVEEGLIEELKSWASTCQNDKVIFESSVKVQEKGEQHIPVEDAIQSAIRVGRLMFTKNHPDYFKFQVLNTLFGGYFGSRLMANIREDKGYTYGIGSGMSVMQDAAYFFITTEVGSDVREAAISEIFAEMERLKTETIDAEELQKVKNYMLGDFLRHADGPMAMMENFKNIHFNDLKTSYYNDYILAVHDTSAADLKKLANKYWKKEDLLIVSAG